MKVILSKGSKIGITIGIIIAAFFYLGTEGYIGAAIPGIVIILISLLWGLKEKS